MRPNRWFWGVVLVVGVLPAVVAATGAAAASESEQTAAELIEQAHQYDGMYGPREKASQQKAIGLYSKVLEAKPDDRQRLHALFRMAQLHGSAYQANKGEKPDIRKAISLYEQIVDSFPPEEPMVPASMGLISDHYTTLREFETALKWAKRALEYDTSEIRKEIEEAKRKVELLDQDASATEQQRVEAIRRINRARRLEWEIERVEGRRVAAVDRVAQSARRIDPLRAHGELRAIADKYAGTAIGERATELLKEGMDKWPALWAPDDELPGGPAAAWEAAPPVPIAFRRNSGDIEAPHDAGLDANNVLSALEPNGTGESNADTPLGKAARAPPVAWVRVFAVGTAALAILALAVLLIRIKLF